MKRLFNVVFAMAIATTSLLPAAHADDQDVIEYRQHIMIAMDEHAAMLGQIVSYAIPNDNVIVHLESLALIASTALKAFEPKVPGGEAKPEIWSDWVDFSEHMNEFSEKISEAARLAKEVRGKDDALIDILDVMTCKSCHEVYREEKE